MSFNDLESGRGGSNSRTGSGNTGTPSAFAKQTNALSRRIFQITSNVTQINRQLQTGKRDTAQSRTTLHTLLETTREQVKQASDAYKELEAMEEADVGGSAARFAKSKMRKDFAIAIASFQEVQRKAQEYQQTYVNTAKQAIEDSEALQEDGVTQQQLQQQVQAAPRLLDNNEIQFNESLIEERESEIQNIEQGITELNEIFRDLGTMVHQQGDLVDSIEANVDNTAVQTQMASTELAKAQRYQRKSRNRMLCLLMILGVILTIVILSVV
ncbi:t-SNARE, partial [Protomyces lactucae-debilis]